MPHDRATPDTLGPAPPPAGARGRWRALPANLRGILLALMAMLMTTFEVVAARSIADRIAIEQIVLVRSAAQILIIIPFVVHARALSRILRTDHKLLLGLRGILTSAGMFFYFYSFSRMPLADATVISFTKALFVVALAGVVLGEVVGGARWAATLVGFLGVLLVVRPGMAEFNIAWVAGILGAMSGAGLQLCTRALALRESPLAIMVYVALITTAIWLPPGLIAWQAPRAVELALLLSVGLCGSLGQFFSILSCRASDASVLAPFDYVRLLYSAAAGFLIFAEIPAALTLAGAAIIIATSLFVAHHEMRRARAAAAVPPPMQQAKETGP